MKRSSSPAASLPRLERLALQRALVPWFEVRRRPLPWRETRDPYAIWISEAMLQQTRVETVIPYYRRFLARFPDVERLASAEEGEVLAVWSGLGYYSRARSLWRAAQAMLARHAGQPPRTREEWLALPGVGPYTAGAVLSIAFSRSEPLVDGNVERVFARLLALEAPRGSPGLLARCWELAAELVPRADEGLDPGTWNQALMELGARVCTPRQPRCGECPLSPHCAARALGRTDELPVPRPRRAPLDVRLEILVPRARGRLLCVRRPPGGRMGGLFEFPTRELAPEGAAPRLWPARLPLACQAGAELGRVTHAITHHRIQALVRAARVPGRTLPDGARWLDSAELAGLALTGLARKVLALSERAQEGAETVP